MRVDRDAIDAEYAIPSVSALPKLDFRRSSPRASGLTSAMTESPIGSIMTAVAVLDTHIERKPVATMNPSTSCFGCVPTRRTVRSAIRRCRFQRCSARARKKPPMNRKIVPEANGLATSRNSATWVTGNATSGTNAVAASGIASVIHHVPISTATAAVTASP